MEDLDTWMKTYINKHYRITFIENLITESFNQGFPGLHTFQRSKITCYLQQDGYFTANSLLLDCIMRIDDFPMLFITFCNKYDCTPRLAHIIEAGIMEYNILSQNLQRPQANLKPVVRHRNEDYQGLLPPKLYSNERGQDNIDYEAANYGSDQVATNSVIRTISDNGVNEDMNGVAVTVDGKDQKKGSLTSSGKVEFLLEQLQCVGEDKTHKQVNENNENSNGVDINVENERSPENECRTTVLVCTNVDNKQSLSKVAQQASCPCPHHVKVSKEEKNLPRQNERQVPNSLSDTENIQRNENMSRKQHNDGLATENTFQGCESNLDINDPIKKSYGGSKMTITDEIIIVDVMNKVNAINDKQNDKNNSTGKENKETVLSFEEKCKKVCVNTDGTTDKKKRLSLQNPKIEKKQNHVNYDSQDEVESSASYYLTSSDEEEFLPALNHRYEMNDGNCEIENLKMPICRPDCLEEPVQKSDKREVISDSNKNTNPKEIERSESSKVNFVMLRTNLSGTQCQEDIEKNKYTREDKTFKKTEIGNTLEVEGGSPSPSLIRNSVSEFAERSEGFKVHINLPGSDESQLGDIYENAVNESCSDHFFVNFASAVSLEIHSKEFSITGVKNDECSIPSDKLNVEDITLVKETNSDSQPETNMLDQIWAEDNLVLTSDNNTRLQELTQETAVNDCKEGVNNCNPEYVNGTISNARSYIFNYIYIPMRNSIHAYFPELSFWF